MVIITTTTGGTTVKVGDLTVPVQRVVVDSNPGGVPVVSLWTDVEVTAAGVVQVMRDPTPQEIDQAARDALSRIDQDAFTRACEAKVRAGRRDPYRVALEVVREMTDG
jgi:hypothetical protein